MVSKKARQCLYKTSDSTGGNQWFRMPKQSRHMSILFSTLMLFRIKKSNVGLLLIITIIFQKTDSTSSMA